MSYVSLGHSTTGERSPNNQSVLSFGHVVALAPPPTFSPCLYNLT